MNEIWMFIFVLLWSALGHLVIWVAIYNRLHATAITRRAKKISERVIYGFVAIIPIAGTFRIWQRFGDTDGMGIRGVGQLSLWNFVDIYAVMCWIAAAAAIVRWCVWRYTLRRPECVRVEELERFDLRSMNTRSENKENNNDNAGTKRWCGDSFTQWLAALPLNQILDIQVNEKVFEFSELPKDLDRVTIAHVSDFHLTGQMTPEFYRQVVEKVNALSCDVVVISGDLVDKPHCLDWIEEIFGRIESRRGTYYVLGNHDCRIADEQLLRSKVAAAGVEAVNGLWATVSFKESLLCLAGNELPWYAGAESLKQTPAPGFRVLVSHSPDQFEWARQRDFDLVLAGHTHGGQIRLPIIGPIISPSVYGPKFASGEFQSGKTLMHVSRGVAGTHPIRINCSPEITRIVLRRAKS